MVGLSFGCGIFFTRVAQSTKLPLISIPDGAKTELPGCLLSCVAQCVRACPNTVACPLLQCISKCVFFFKKLQNGDTQSTVKCLKSKDILG